MHINWHTYTYTLMHPYTHAHTRVCTHTPQTKVSLRDPACTWFKKWVQMPKQNWFWSDINYHSINWTLVMLCPSTQTVYLQSFKGCNFQGFCSQWPSRNLNFIGKNFSWRAAGYTWMVLFDTCKGWWQILNLPTAATKVVSKVVAKLATLLRLTTLCNPFCMTFTVDCDVF